MFHVKHINLKYKKRIKRGKEFKIMGYKMPIVCKEVYLPWNALDESLSFDAYKSKYGIDLYNIFTIDEFKENDFDPTNFGLIDPYTKLFGVPVNFDSNVSFVTILNDIVISNQTANLVFQGTKDSSRFAISLNCNDNVIRYSQI